MKKQKETKPIQQPQTKQIADMSSEELGMILSGEYEKLIGIRDTIQAITAELARRKGKVQKDE